MVLLETLDEIRFLEGIAPEHLGRIASAGRLKEYPPGALLFCEGKHSDYIYLVARGEVGLEIRAADGGASPVQVIGPGELLGWSPILGPGPVTATARTRTTCRLIALDAKRMLAMCDAEPRFGMEFIRRTATALAGRLDATRRRMLDQPASCKEAVAGGTA
jgi:CRP/FNR family cyclic AMP-dependent transcriptional regulator